MSDDNDTWLNISFVSVEEDGEDEDELGEEEEELEEEKSVSNEGLVEPDTTLCEMLSSFDDRSISIPATRFPLV